MSENHKRALLVVAHGSRRNASNDEIRHLVEQLGCSEMNDFDMVMAAFLELAEPSIPDGIEDCIQRGASEVLVFPYFLSAGRHVTEDIPAAVKIKQQQHSSITIIIADYLGISDGMPGMIFEHLNAELKSPES